MNRICSGLHKALIHKKLSIAVAESCTGGLLGFLLTATPGSSKYFKLGLITYSNKTKQKLLNIPGRLIKAKGAVSQEIASKMAQNIKYLAKTDIGVGITGIAGPTGGTIQKPVGTVFIALALKGRTSCKKFLFKGSRDKIRKQSALEAMKLIRKVL